MRREIEVRVFEVIDEECGFDCVEEIVDEECVECTCPCCPYEDESGDDAEVEYITDKVQELIDCGMCPDCALEFVVDLYETAYDNGQEDFRLGMIEDLMDTE